MFPRQVITSMISQTSHSMAARMHARGAGRGSRVRRSRYSFHPSSRLRSHRLACGWSNADRVTTQTARTCKIKNVTQIIQGFFVSLTIWVPNDVFTISNAPTLESGSKQ